MHYAQKRPKLIGFGGWLLIASACLLFLSSSLLRSADALSLSSPRDFDNNAVLNGGCLTTAECQQKYHGTGVVGIYNRFGIASSDMSNLGTTARACQVFKNGNVSMDGQVIATNAITAGRQDMSGSSKVMAGGVAFYERPPSVSFTSSPLPSFCVMKNGQFAFAIIASCGNPVRATPVAKPVTPPTQAPQPSPSPTPPPPPVPSPAPVPSQTPQEITKAGPAQVISVGILATAAGTIGHYIYMRRQSS